MRRQQQLMREQLNGISKGTTNIIAKTANGLVETKCKVNVIEIQEDAYIEFDDTLTIEGDEISNLNLDHLTVNEILNLINTNMRLEILKYDNTKLNENQNVGTGSKLIIKNANNDVIYQYKFILYGDVNGDGNINSLDVLVLQKHILEIKLLSQEFLKAGNTSRNGEMPSSLDVLKLQKHILEIKPIKQGEKISISENYVQENKIIDKSTQSNDLNNETNEAETENNINDQEKNNATDVDNKQVNKEESDISNNTSKTNTTINNEASKNESISNTQNNIINEKVNELQNNTNALTKEE